MSHRIAKDNRRSLRRKGIDWRAVPRPPSKVRHPFKRAAEMHRKIALILKEHGDKHVERDTALKDLGGYTSRGKGRDKGKMGCRRGFHDGYYGSGGKPQNNNPQSRECQRRVRQQLRDERNQLKRALLSTPGVTFAAVDEMREAA